jgi:hypothetical protein
MADYSAIYTLTTPGPDITFNNGTFGAGSVTDLYWIDTIHGLDGPSLRVPSEDVPFGDGGLVHRSWKGPRHPVFEGRMIVQSVGVSECQAVFNLMEKNLREALGFIIAPSSGTLAWTPAGDVAYSLTVYYEQSLDVQPGDNYRTRTFSFGLISPASDP